MRYLTYYDIQMLYDRRITNTRSIRMQPQGQRPDASKPMFRQGYQIPRNLSGPEAPETS